LLPEFINEKLTNKRARYCKNMSQNLDLEAVWKRKRLVKRTGRKRNGNEGIFPALCREREM
jgi:hypothetical protein